MAEKKDNVAVKYKDNVFCMLYRDKNNLLELYNALNDSNYTNVDDLEVTTLKDGSYMKYKNDASFVLNMSLYMFEQQSSKNENMPLRFMHYLSDVYREMFGNELLHRRTMIKIPVPYFVTFYNGKEKWDRDKLTLAEMFERHVDNPQIDLEVKVIDINGNAEILNKCKSLRDYMTFVEKVRNKTDVKKMNVREAVIQAIDECIEQNILVDFFKEHREEIVEMSIYDYEEEKVRKTLADEAREEGVAEGIEEGECIKVITQIIKKVKKSKTLPIIASELEEEEADIKPIYDAVIASAPDYDIEEIKAKLK
ncbi:MULTISPECIES: Rpn family recombination-promoting nuclease/putative transposase [Clostridia]|uniref:Rpn family recombination-promoting nuclease/putative transposase n=1 Tax=Clostridia TaxID=186801 RepID=UPI000E5C867F|nr:Rpn family recombination-promoting nuclease/putative transposase [Eubacterium sp. AF22-9]RGS29069.1 hypothetical protein DWY02_11565 [Eubacterium sp. AF22-9]